jgi:glycosyltransferase involved in cell wall biosynthesis
MNGHAVAKTDLPLVSVIVPCYNHARYLERCLDSLLEDGYPNLELVLIDDGSKDDSFAIAERWVAAHGARLAGGAQIRRQANAGLTPTLNRLTAAARGAFFTMLASDDYLLPGGIQARVRHLLAHPELLAVCADASAIDEDGLHLADSVLDRRKVSRAAMQCRDTIAIELIIHWRMPGPVLLCRREIVDCVGPYDERFAIEDRNYYLRMLAAGALGYVDRVVSAYRIQRVRDPMRYHPMLGAREQTEREMVPRFRGLERLALTAMLERYPVLPPPAPSTLRWKIVRRGLKLLRRFNTWRARRQLALGTA